MDRLRMDWRAALWQEILWTWPKSKLNNLFWRAQLYDMQPFDFYFSEVYNGPNEPYPSSNAQAETKEEYYKRQDAEERSLKKKQAAYRKKQLDKVWQLEKALERKRHDKMLSDICGYAMSHGWSPDRLQDLLEPGERLPWMYQLEQIDPASIRLEPGQPSLPFKDVGEEDKSDGLGNNRDRCTWVLGVGRINKQCVQHVEGQT